MNEADKIRRANEAWLKKDYQKIKERRTQLARKFKQGKAQSAEHMVEKWFEGTA